MGLVFPVVMLRKYLNGGYNKDYTDWFIDKIINYMVMINKKILNRDNFILVIK